MPPDTRLQQLSVLKVLWTSSALACVCVCVCACGFVLAFAQVRWVPWIPKARLLQALAQGVDFQNRNMHLSLEKGSRNQLGNQATNKGFNPFD